MECKIVKETIVQKVGRERNFVASLTKNPKGKKERMKVKANKTDCHSKRKDKMVRDIRKRKKMERLMKRRQHYNVELDGSTSDEVVEKIDRDIYNIKRRERFMKRRQYCCGEFNEEFKNYSVDQDGNEEEEASKEVEAPALVVDHIGATQEWPEGHDILKL